MMLQIITSYYTVELRVFLMQKITFCGLNTFSPILSLRMRNRRGARINQEPETNDEILAKLIQIERRYLTFGVGFSVCRCHLYMYMHMYMYEYSRL